MKAEFKYSFRTGLSVRGIAFCIVFAMMLVFIILGSLGLLPFAALVTAVSLGGVGIAAVVVTGIISDIMVVRRMFSAPGAYLYALTPAHRGRTLFASIITMMVLDVVTIAAVIIGEVWLSFLLAYGIVPQDITGIIGSSITSGDVIWGIVMTLAGYLFVMMTIIFGIAVSKSVFYQKKAAGLLTFLSVCACYYVFSLLQLTLIPFGTVSRFAAFISINISGPAVAAAMSVYVLLLLLSAAGLFILTSRLMERKLNI